MGDGDIADPVINVPVYINPLPADYDYSRFYFVLLAD